MADDLIAKNLINDKLNKMYSNEVINNKWNAFNMMNIISNRNIIERICGPCDLQLSGDMQYVCTIKKRRIYIHFLYKKEFIDMIYIYDIYIL